MHYTAKGNLVTGAGSVGVVTRQVWLFLTNLLAHIVYMDVNPSNTTSTEWKYWARGIVK